ncbi:MAG TPA: cytochrome P450 [Gemmatirosa sp.]
MAHASMGSLPRASVGESLAVLGDVVAPTIAKGVILRRPRVVAAAERFQLDRRAVQRLQRLRDRYGAGPLMLRMPPGREQAVILAPEHVRRVLDATPEPFATASSEKRAALSHFQPDGVLISHGAVRAERRRYNEAVLETACPMHHLAARFERVVREEAAELLASIRRVSTPGTGVMDWDAFAVAWWRAVRRVVLGDGARDDEVLTNLLQGLRSDANWAFLQLRRLAVRDRFFARLEAHVARAEPGSLAAVMAAVPAHTDTAAVGQVPQWLFAFDAAGITTVRALALLATHPAYAGRARAEALGASDTPGSELPLLRAAVMDTVRLWPTTPMVLRQTTAETTWEAGVMPAGTGVLIFVPFFDRDDERLAYANRFAPELWLEGTAPAGHGGRAVGEGPATAWPLVPFSAGPAACAGRNLVLLLSSTMLAALLRESVPRVVGRAPLDAERPLPATLDNYTLRFALDA